MSQPSPPNPAAQSANSAGMAALQAGNPAEAARHFAEAARADPGATALWRNLANAHRLNGDDTGERTALEQALAIDQTDFMAWLRKSQLLTRRGEDGAAMTAWAATLQLAKRYADLPGDLLAQVDEGRARFAGWQQTVATAVDSELADRLAAMAGTDARRARAFVDHSLGRRSIYANQCAGLLYPFLPADEYFDERHFPWFAELGAATPAIRAELEALIAGGAEDALRPYVRMDAGTPQNEWSDLDHSLAWGAAFLWEYGEPNRPLLDRCPATAAALERLPRAGIPGRAPSAFFSLLKPRTRIPPHTGVSNTRAIIHLPLIVPPGCGFRVGGETREWVEGVPFAFDDTIEHEAWNDSDVPRYILICDIWNPRLSPQERAAIAGVIAATDAFNGTVPSAQV